VDAKHGSFEGTVAGVLWEAGLFARKNAGVGLHEQITVLGK
jgi:hypothetical protein